MIKEMLYKLVKERELSLVLMKKEELLFLLLLVIQAYLTKQNLLN